MKRVVWLVLVSLGMVGAGSCPTGVLAEEKKDNGTAVRLDGLTSVTPASWKEEKPSGKLRYKQFRLPRTGDDKEDAEVVIFKDVGGSLADNLPRWKAQFAPPKGKKIDDVTRIEKMKAGDVPFTWVEIHGTYKGSPFQQMKPKPDYRMVRIFFESKNGPHFISLIGPEKTVEAHKKGYLDWVKGFK
jgi:hypothetical protein